MSDTHRAIEAVWRIESAKLIAGLARMVRDVGLAEDLAQDALVAALERWPESGVPDNPGAWLMATAKHRAIDALRRGKLVERKHEQLGHELEERQQSPERDLDTALDDQEGGAEGLAARIASEDLNADETLALACDDPARARLVLAAEEAQFDLHTVTRLQQLKTGALLGAAVEMGAILGRVPEEGRGPLRAYARDIGLAFQIADDLIDAEGDAATAGLLRAAVTRALEAVEASGFHSELWSYAVEGGRVVPMRYGSGADVQLWSTTDLAVAWALREMGRNPR